MTRLVLVLALTSCQVVDTLDGHIDDIDNCCVKLSRSGVRECLISFAVPGDCVWITCLAPIGYVEGLLRNDAGDVTACIWPEDQDGRDQ